MAIYQIRMPCAAVSAMLALAAAAAPATAAVNECVAEIAGQRVAAKAELEAKKLALADWIAQARKLGEGYTRWQIAFNRRFDCQPAPPGVSCQAIARPCMIKQVPSSNTVPLKRSP
jgi:hypothetical protein